MSKCYIEWRKEARTYIGCIYVLSEVLYNNVKLIVLSWSHTTRRGLSWCHRFHLKNKEALVQRSYRTCPRSHSNLAIEGTCGKSEYRTLDSKLVSVFIRHRTRIWLYAYHDHLPTASLGPQMKSIIHHWPMIRPPLGQGMAPGASSTQFQPASIKQWMLTAINMPTYCHSYWLPVHEMETTHGLGSRKVFYGLLIRKLYQLPGTILQYVQVYYCYLDTLHCECTVYFIYKHTHTHICRVIK